MIAVNKIDRPDARVKEVIDEILLFLMDLGATDEQLDSPMVFCSGRAGTASYSPDVPGTDLVPLFRTILDYVAPPEGDPGAPLAMLCSSIDYNEFVGRIGIGRVENGTLKVGQDVTVCDWHDKDLAKRGRITALYSFAANGRTPVEEAARANRGVFRPDGYLYWQHFVRPGPCAAPAVRQNKRPHGGDDLLGK